jgi:glucose/arabinose dehydrogenase
MTDVVLPCRSSVAIRTTFFACCLLLFFGACGGDSPSEPLTGSVGPAGGTLAFAAGKVRLEVPPGAVASEVTFTVESATGYPDDPRIVDETIYRFGPEGLQFAEPVRLTLSYERAKIPAGLREGELRLFRVVGAAWQQVSGSEPDATARSVSGLIGGFSVLGILGVPVASVAVTPQTSSVQVSATVQLTATVKDASGNVLPDRAVAWSSSPANIAEVDGDGSVTGLSTGDATITASSEGQTDEARVTVVQTANPELELVASGVSSPVFLTAPPGDAERLFVVERPGRVVVIRNGAVLATPFLDIQDLVTSGGERGLLSVAFHPDYAQTGEFFVDYIDGNGDTRVARYRVSTNPDVADPGSERVILTVTQPYSNHNGGQLVFGPDGMLYIGLGDGGSGGDPLGNGQDPSTLLGSILRIDVDGGTPYAIPADNPLVSVAGARDEIWAYGLRNPWRFSFDRETGDLYIGDVGQGAWEEVDVQPAESGGGENYGWNVMEGAHCYNASSCDQTELILPVLEYSHSEGCSITGGYVYRGSSLPILAGHYLYADYCSGWIRSFRYVGGEAVDSRDWSSVLAPGTGISSFGEDAEGELYVMTLSGNVYRIVPSEGQ